ncbi:MAG: hypothetical protein LBC35_05555 [Coriobacteriales bacterium]|jgi:hypothetical protein|nr:hypothetical protein [Coriobacteriales bacterium]
MKSFAKFVRHTLCDALAALLALTLVFALAGCGGVRATMAEVTRAKDESLEGARNKYNQRDLTLTGYYLGDIDFGSSYMIYLGAKPDKPYEQWRAECTIPRSEVEGQLNAGDEVTVTGFVSSLQDMALFMNSCHIVSVTPAGAGTDSGMNSVSASGEKSGPEVKDAKHLREKAEGMGFRVSAQNSILDKDTGEVVAKLNFSSNAGTFTIVPDAYFAKYDETKQTKLSRASAYQAQTSFSRQASSGFSGFYCGASPDGKYEDFVFYNDKDPDYPQNWDLSEGHYDFIVQVLSSIEQGKEGTPFPEMKIPSELSKAIQSNGFSYQYFGREDGAGFFVFNQGDNQSDYSKVECWINSYSTGRITLQCSVYKHGNQTNRYSKEIDIKDSQGKVSENNGGCYYDVQTNTYIWENSESLSLVISALNGDYSSFKES